MRNTAAHLLLCTILGICSATQSVAEGCFRTAGEAAAGAGVRDGEGFRLEGTRLDPLAGGQWATVRSCLHPERPAQVVKTSGSGVVAAVASSPSQRQAVAGPLLVRAGQVVQVIRTESFSRLRMEGVAQQGGALGALVRVRLEGSGEGTAERFADAVVLQPGVLQLEAAR